MKQQLPVVRSCGTCRLCCTLFPVHPLQKPAGTRCAHENPDPEGPGCTITGTDRRPAECGLYACGWLSGIGPDAWRPDRVGYLWNVDPWNQEIVIKEARPGVSRTEEAMEFFDILATRLGQVAGDGAGSGFSTSPTLEETP